MAKLTPEQIKTRGSIRESRKSNADLTQGQRDAAAAANVAARKAAKKAAADARRRNRSGVQPFGSLVQPDEMPAPAKVDLNKPIQPKRDDAGEIDTSGLQDNQIVDMGGGKRARYDTEIGGFTDVEYNPSLDRFVVPEVSTGPTAGQKTLIQSMPALINMAQTFASQSGDTALLAEVQKLQREMDSVNADTALDEDMRAGALLGLQERARTIQERVQTAKLVAGQEADAQRLASAQQQLVIDYGNFATELNEKFRALDAGFVVSEQQRKTRVEQSNPSSAEGGSLMQQQFSAYSQIMQQQIKDYDEQVAAGTYPPGATRPVPMSYDNFLRAKMTEHHIDKVTQEAIAPLQHRYDRAMARRELLLEHLSQGEGFVSSVVGLRKPDGSTVSRAEAVEMFNMQTVDQQKALVAVDANIASLSNTINRELEQGRIVNPGSENPTTVRALSMMTPEERRRTLYKGSPLTQASVPVAKGARPDRRVAQRTPTADVGGVKTELPLTMMGREMAAGRDITETGGYDVSYAALAKDPSAFRAPNPQEQSIVTTEEYERFVNAPQYRREMDAAFKDSTRDIGNRLLTLYAQSGQRAVSREVEFQAEKTAKEKTLAAGKSNPVSVATTGQAFSPR